MLLSDLKNNCFWYNSFFFSLLLQNQRVELDDDRLELNAIGVGMRGRNEYSVSIEFYLEVDSKVHSTIEIC